MLCLMWLLLYHVISFYVSIYHVMPQVIIIMSCHVIIIFCTWFAMSCYMWLLPHHVISSLCFAFDWPCYVVCNYFYIMLFCRYTLYLICHIMLDVNIDVSCHFIIMLCIRFVMLVVRGYCHIMSFHRYVLHAICDIILHVIIAMSCQMSFHCYGLHLFVISCCWHVIIAMSYHFIVMFCI